MKPTLAALCAAVFVACGAARAEPTLVIVVRHAERAAEPGSDPGLSAAGTQRAQLLAEQLAGAAVSAIVATPFRRSRDTALPTAQRFGIEPQWVAVRRGESAAHVPEVVAAVRQQSGVVLVVGHSNTVAEIVAGLSKARPLPLCESSHSHVFVISLQPAGAAVLQFRYGAADPAPTAGCQ
jgi:phosphohistidine phosphatase SixA